MQVGQVVIAPIPGGVMTVVGFLAFGPFLGFLLNYSGILFGSWCFFRLVRQFGRKMIYLFLSEDSLAEYEDRFLGSTFEKLCILVMLAPIGPADITVMLAGLSKMSEKRLMLILALCRPVSMITYSRFWIYGGSLIQSILPF